MNFQISDCENVELKILISNTNLLDSRDNIWSNIIFLVLFNYFCIKNTTPNLMNLYPKSQEEILLKKIRQNFDLLQLEKNEKLEHDRFEIILNDYELRMNSRQLYVEQDVQLPQYTQDVQLLQVIPLQQQSQSQQNQPQQKKQQKNQQQQNLQSQNQQEIEQQQQDVQLQQQNKQVQNVADVQKELHQLQQQVQNVQQKYPKNRQQLQNQKEQKIGRNNFDIMLGKAFFYCVPITHKHKYDFNQKLIYNLLLIENNYVQIDLYLTIRKSSLLINNCLKNIKTFNKLFNPNMKFFNENFLIIESTLLYLGEQFMQFNEKTHEADIIRSKMIDYGLPLKSLIELAQLFKKYSLFSIIEGDKLRLYSNGILGIFWF